LGRYIGAVAGINEQGVQLKGHQINDLCEVYRDSCALTIAVVAGVVYELRYLAEPQLQARAIDCKAIIESNAALSRVAFSLDNDRG